MNQQQINQLNLDDLLECTLAESLLVATKEIYEAVFNDLVKHNPDGMDETALALMAGMHKIMPALDVHISRTIAALMTIPGTANDIMLLQYANEEIDNFGSESPLSINDDDSVTFEMSVDFLPAISTAIDVISPITKNIMYGTEV